MNDAKKTIGWCDVTWNPVTGCYHKCPYCYARSMARRFEGFSIWDGKAEDRHVIERETGPVFELDRPQVRRQKDGKIVSAPYPYGFNPTLHRYKLAEPRETSSPKTVFVGSMADLFGDWVPDEWIYAVFDACRKAPQHKYLFLTKNPWRYARLDLPEEENFWFGATGTDHQSAEFAFRYLPPMWKYKFFLSAEPLLGGMNLAALASWPRWIIIGAQTGPGSIKHVPRRVWVDDILRFCDKFDIPVFMKDSLAPVMEEGVRREFPWAEI